MRYIFIFISCLIFFSCRKDQIRDIPQSKQPESVVPTYSLQAPSEMSPALLPDQIVYTPLVPQVVLSYTPQIMNQINYDIDLDKDKISDFRITLNRVKYLWCATPPINEGSFAWGTNIKVTGLSPLNMLTVAPYSNTPVITGYYSPNTYLLGFGQVISVSNFIFDDQPKTLFYDATGLASRYCFKGLGYLPLVFEGTKYGWILVEGFGAEGKIAIKGFAYNKTQGNPIKAGQIQ